MKIHKYSVLILSRIFHAYIYVLPTFCMKDSFGCTIYVYLFTEKTKSVIYTSPAKTAKRGCNEVLSVHQHYINASCLEPLKNYMIYRLSKHAQVLTSKYCFMMGGLEMFTATDILL